MPLARSLIENRAALAGAFGNSPDLVLRDLQLSPQGPEGLLVCLNGLVEASLVGSSVIEAISLMDQEDAALTDPAKLLEALRLRYLATTEVVEVSSMRPLLRRLTSGSCVLLLDRSATGLAVHTAGWRERRIDDSPSESTIRGPRDSFIETLDANVAMIRRRFRHPSLRFEPLVVGRATQTDIVVAHLLGIARESIVKEVLTRLRRIDIDGILESGYIEELIEDQPLSPFPQILRTDRPDRVAAALLEGRVAVLVDGTPFALVMPATITMFLTSPEDYYDRWPVGTFLRLVRYAAFAVSMALPSLYVALTTFHQEMLPTPLALSIAAQRRGVPVPAIVEAFLLELAFELFREAGLRLPRIIGPAITIAGTLVIGEAAARAGLVSPVMVVAVALTGISSFAIPVYSMGISIRLIRFPLLLLSALMGLFGLATGLSLLLIHVCSLRSFGVPYTSPFSPLTPGGVRDSVVRAPIWAHDRRPELVAHAKGRVAARQMPRPPKGGPGR